MAQENITQEFDAADPGEAGARVTLLIEMLVEEAAGLQAAAGHDEEGDKTSL